MLGVAGVSMLHFSWPCRSHGVLWMHPHSHVFLAVWVRLLLLLVLLSSAVLLFLLFLVWRFLRHVCASTNVAYTCQGLLASMLCEPGVCGCGHHKGADQWQRHCRCLAFSYSSSTAF